MKSQDKLSHITVELGPTPHVEYDALYLCAVTWTLPIILPVDH